MIWLTSYPKSGNTWVRILFAMAQQNGAVSLEELVGNLSTYSPWEADRKWFDQVSGQEWSQLDGRTMFALRPQAQQAMEAAHGDNALVKSHNWAAGAKGTTIYPMGMHHRAIYVVRNPLDVAVSLKHHMGEDEDTILRVMTNEEMIARRTKTCAWEVYGSWQRHVSGWLEKPPYPTCYLRYEDLVEGRAGLLAAAFEHVGMDIDQAQAQELLDATSIGHLRAVEDKVGFDEIPTRMGHFFRQGKTGTWKQGLSPAARTQLVNECKPLMDHFGFEY